MKKILFLILSSAILFASCTDMTAGDQNGGTAANNVKPSGERVSMYDKDGLSFDIPESWQQNFKAVTREVGSAGNTYPQTDFYYTANGRDIRLMSIGKYTREQWDSLKSKGEDVKDAMLGESADKKNVYSIYYENHDYIKEKDLSDVLAKIKGEAEKLRDKIKIS